MCQVNFTFDVLKAPTLDQDPFTPGQQTVQVVDDTQIRRPDHQHGLRPWNQPWHDGESRHAIDHDERVGQDHGRHRSGARRGDGVGKALFPQPGATIDFRLYGPDDATCSGAPVFESLGVPYPVTDEPVTSAAFVPVVAGDYRWVATYSGDTNNNPVSGECNSTNEIVTVSPPPAPQILSAGPILPATGSSTGVLLFIALGSTLAGLVLVVSTSSRRRLARVPTRR